MRGFDLYSALSPGLDADSDFANLGVVRTYGPGSELLQQGTPADEIYLIRDGLVKLVWTEPKGRQSIVGLRWRGYLLGVPSAITAEASPMSAITLVRSVMQRISAQEFLESLQTNSTLAWKMHQIHSRELCEQLNSLGELACCSARSRLGRVFRRLVAAGQTQVEGKKTRVRLPLKQREVAELIGVTPEHLNRILRSLSDDGVVQVRKGWIVIPNLQALSALEEIS
jgi:CRP/FNR family transcriptional regulator